MINNFLVLSNIVFFLTCSLVIWIFPVLDLKVSMVAYNVELGFIHKEITIVQILYQSIPVLTKILLSTLFISFIILYILYLTKLKVFRNIHLLCCTYLLSTVAIGPGLIVNYLLKEHVGRARPAQITSFSGTKDFAPIFSLSDQCEHNCSFASGHAAMAYYFTALVYAISLYRQYNRSSSNPKNISSIQQSTQPILTFFSDNANINILYVIIIIFASLVGLSRILMGGHFLSDVTFAAFIVLLINHAFYLIWQKFIDLTQNKMRKYQL